MLIIPTKCKRDIVSLKNSSPSTAEKRIRKHLNGAENAAAENVSDCILNASEINTEKAVMKMQNKNE
jgi:LPS O-antigen subunit length determinant protein (WzzB/FepE family)